MNNRSNNINNIPDSEKSGKSKKVKDYEKDERFMRFYSEYPKKIDPKDAWKAFKSIVGNDDDLLEQIIQDIRNRKQNHSQWQDKKYIKYPAVYLRKGEYLGEIYNEAQEQAEKKQKAEEENQKRISEQEAASQRLADMQRKNDIHKQADASAYRNLLNQAQTKAGTSTLKNLKNYIRR